MQATSTTYQLDLHGLTKDKAISQLTSFLDQIRYDKTRANSALDKEIKVTIVTGSGSHSSNGPILRSAVEKVLKKRQMTYYLTFKKGAFVVDALSGIDLYQESVQDTKLLVVPDEEFPILNNRKAIQFRSSSKRQLGDFESKQVNYSNVCDENGDYNPLPSEVAADDDDLAKVKQLSLEEAARTQSHATKEINELKQAIVLSVESQQHREAQEMEEMDDMITKAIKLSTDMAQKEQAIMDEELCHVLEMSKKEANTYDYLEEESLKYAISLSQREAEMNQKYVNQLEMDEEASIQLVLEMSNGQR